MYMAQTLGLPDILSFWQCCTGFTALASFAVLLPAKQSPPLLEIMACTCLEVPYAMLPGLGLCRGSLTADMLRMYMAVLHLSSVLSRRERICRDEDAAAKRSRIAQQREEALKRADAHAAEELIRALRA